MLIVLGHRNSNFYNYNQIAFFFSFLICRIVLNTVMIYYVIRCATLTFMETPILQTPIPQLILGAYLLAIFCSHYSLNMYWFTKMLHYLRKYTFQDQMDLEVDHSRKERLLIEEEKQQDQDRAEIDSKDGPI
mmetsp:Transcript_30084/g.22343  ORF Transcript_30084/g.22343 Transcript_30084/m.22343 type:complete len:132 (-) Transcript_30084:73-468(-)